MGSVVYIDSFDHYTTVADKGWVGSIYFGVVAARNGNGLYAAGNWQGGNNGSVYRDLPAGYPEIILGFALRSTRLANEQISLQEGGTNHIYFEWDGSGHLVAKNGAGTVIGTTTSVWSTNSDKYVEIHAKIADSGGFLRIYVNGGLEVNVTGIDTKNGGSGVVSRFRLDGYQITFEGDHKIIVDDLYIIDNTDGVSTPLGDSKVECRFPSGNGNSSQLDGSDGNTTDNYLLVDETPPNGDTDYVESATVGNKDTYVTQDLAAPTGVVHAVQVNLYAKKSDAGARSLASVARLSGTEADSSSVALSTTYGYQRDIRLAKPGSGGWTISDFNSTEFGAKVSA